ncbi:MAG: CocE/NonD family hydrolase [Cyclobacteriaceae bacterium]
MRKIHFFGLQLLALLLSMSVAKAQNPDSVFVRENYEKREVYIPMRDGVKLFTAIYLPKDQSAAYPILMKRTCYSIAPYGEEKFPGSLGPSPHLMRDGYIFVYQDVRGRYMSEGEFVNMRPNRDSEKEVDESSDTFDTIEWLLKELKKRTNGKVGQWGISYPGFYTIAGAVDAHPALKASSPQAPISDFFFDDFHHHGAFLQSYWFTFPVFGASKDEPTTEPWYEMVRPATPDAYEFHKALGPLKNSDKYYEDNFFWQEVSEHPNYDQFWQERSILPHLNNIDHAIMTVGGWFDAEDLYGPLNIYKTVEANNPGTYNTLVMGPWSHGDWSRERGIQAVGNIYFGDSISTFYQKNIELPFFNHFLKDGPQPNLPEAYLFDTGLKEWKQFDTWPPANTPRYTFTFKAGDMLQPDKLEINQMPDDKQVFEYVSDPENPVPSTEDIKITFTPRKFMTDDQRYASRRPDVLTFVTEPLEDNLTLLGEIMARLKVSTSGTDADFVVKLIDVHPGDAEDSPVMQDHLRMGGYQMLVRSEVFRGRFRNSYEKPEPFTPDQITEVEFPLQDILHTFKKGHQVMIQIHSTWFPYIDRNPQKYVENIFEAEAGDFQKATMRVHGSSVVEIGKLNPTPAAVKLMVK